MKKIYVGCSLIHAPEEFVKEVEEFKNILKQEGLEIFDFLGMGKGTPADVYERDINQCVANCDIFLAIADFPSTGLGYEIRAAEEWGKKVVIAAHEKSVVSRLILGVNKPNFSFQRYERLEDLVKYIKDFS